MSDWIREGAPVIVVEQSRGFGFRTPITRRSTITRVTKAKFAVDGINDLFSQVHHRTRKESPYWEAFPADSDKAARYLAEYERKSAVDAAEMAAHRWSREHTPENRLVLMEALAKLEKWGL